MATFTEKAVIEVKSGAEVVMPEGNWKITDAHAVLTAAVSGVPVLKVTKEGDDVCTGPVTADGTDLANADPDKSVVRWSAIDDEKVSISQGDTIAVSATNCECDVFISICRT